MSHGEEEPPSRMVRWFGGPVLQYVRSVRNRHIREFEREYAQAYTAAHRESYTDAAPVPRDPTTIDVGKLLQHVRRARAATDRAAELDAVYQELCTLLGHPDEEEVTVAPPPLDVPGPVAERLRFDSLRLKQFFEDRFGQPEP